MYIFLGDLGIISHVAHRKSNTMNYSLESRYPDYFLGMSLFRNSNHHEAIKSFSSAVNTHPYCIIAYFHRGRSYVNLKQYENALSDFNRALTIAINNQDRTDLRENYYIENYDIYMDRGLAYSSLGEYQKAIQDYQTARKEIIDVGDPAGQELLPELNVLIMSATAYILNNKQPAVSSEPSAKVNNIDTVAKGYVEEQKTSYDWDNRVSESDKKIDINYVKEYIIRCLVDLVVFSIPIFFLAIFIVTLSGGLSWKSFRISFCVSLFITLSILILAVVSDTIDTLKNNNK